MGRDGVLHRQFVELELRATERISASSGRYNPIQAIPLRFRSSS